MTHTLSGCNSGCSAITFAVKPGEVMDACSIGHLRHRHLHRIIMSSYTHARTFIQESSTTGLLAPTHRQGSTFSGYFATSCI